MAKFNYCIYKYTNVCESKICKLSGLSMYVSVVTQARSSEKFRFFNKASPPLLSS